MRIELYKEKIITNVFQKPLLFYNKSIFIFEFVDQLVRKCSVNAGRFQWLLQVFE